MTVPKGNITVQYFLLLCICFFATSCFFNLLNQKQLKESLESHLVKKEEFFNIIHRDQEKMDTIKVHWSVWPQGLAALNR